MSTLTIFERMGYAFLILAALLHVGFFLLESIFFQRPEGYKYFKVPKEDHQASKIWALNQGYYNLFLALGLLTGVFSLQIYLSVFCALSMIGAGLVLRISSPKLKRGALIQTLPPLIGLMLLFLPRI